MNLPACHSPAAPPLTPSAVPASAMPVETVAENGQPGFLSILLFGLLEDPAPQIAGEESTEAAAYGLEETEDYTEEAGPRVNSASVGPVVPMPALPLCLFCPDSDRGRGDEAQGGGLSPEAAVLLRGLDSCSESAPVLGQTIVPAANTESRPAQVSSASGLSASGPVGAGETGVGNGAVSPVELNALRAWHHPPSPSSLAFAVRLSPRAGTGESNVEGGAKSSAFPNATISQPNRPELPQAEAPTTPDRVPSEEVTRPSDLDLVPSGTEGSASLLRRVLPRSEFHSADAAAETDRPPKPSVVPQPEISHTKFSDHAPFGSPINISIQSESAHEPGTIAPVRATEPVDPPAAGPAPLRDLAFRLEGAADAVEVRLSERGGTVHIAVHTSDSDLAGTLRQNLGELSTRLGARGIQAETSQPNATSEPARAESDPGNDPGYGKQHGGDSGRHDQPSRRRQSLNEKDNESERKEFSWIVSSTQ